jgi:hypothetical protein
MHQEAKIDIWADYADRMLYFGKKAAMASGTSATAGIPNLSHRNIILCYTLTVPEAMP